MSSAPTRTLCALATLLIVACSAANSNGGQAQGPVAIADLARDPARYVGETVTLEGVYQGFDVSACSFPDGARTSGLTRGDWLVRTGGDCMYVTGGVPPGVDPIDPGVVGRAVRVSATVRESDGRSLFLQYRDGALIDR